MCVHVHVLPSYVLQQVFKCFKQMFFFLFLRFDVADRLFFSIEASFNSVLNSLNDCKEITPDFFCLPEFLVNMNGKLSTHL